MTKHRKDRPDMILAVIEDYRREYGYAPTVREIMVRVGLSSTSAVHHHLLKMDRAGLLERGPGARAIRPPEQPDPLDLTAAALHRWRHPSFKGYSRCHCRDHAKVALELVRGTA